MKCRMAGPLPESSIEYADGGIVSLDVNRAREIKLQAVGVADP